MPSDVARSIVVPHGARVHRPASLAWLPQSYGHVICPVLHRDLCIISQICAPATQKRRRCGSSIDELGRLAVVLCSSPGCNACANLAAQFARSDGAVN